jgi:hypothetical protein
VDSTYEDTKSRLYNYISKLIDINDRQITDKCFDLEEEALGPHTIVVLLIITTQKPEGFSHGIIRGWTFLSKV